MLDPTLWVYENRDKYDTDQHETERASNGFSTYDWWNFCDYTAWVNIQALERFKTGVGHPVVPGECETMEDWVAELDVMINGFKSHLTLQNDYPESQAEADELRAVYEKGLALYVKRFSSLWD